MLMRKIKLPFGDGTSKLQEVDQSYVLVAAELLDILDGKRDKPSKGSISFAKNVVFRDVLADRETQVQCVSLGMAQQLSDVFMLFQRDGLICSATDFRPHKSTPFASVYLESGDRSINIWFAPSEPYIDLETDGKPPTLKSMFPSLRPATAPRPTVKFNIPRRASASETSVPKRQKLERPATVNTERANYWEEQLTKIGRGGDPVAQNTRPPVVQSLAEQIEQRYGSGAPKSTTAPLNLPPAIGGPEARELAAQLHSLYGTH